MIEESAKVIACDGDYAVVETQTKAACGSCHAEQSCSTSVLAGLFKRRRNHLKVLNPIHATPGQRVVIGLQERALVSASLVAYLLPLVSLILVSIAAQQAALHLGWPDGELGGILGGLLGLTIGLYVLKRYASNSSRDAGFRAVILRQEVGGAVPFI
jgi:sigma-E factor negative regulatory protein RseC